MILGYDDICAELDKGLNGLIIDPMPEDGCFQPASIDITLKADLTIGGKPFSMGKGTLYIGRKTGLVLGSTRERFIVPPHLAMQLDGKSTLARKGLSIHRTAGWIDPGFQGEVTLEMSVVGDERIALRAGMRIGQVKFMQLRTPTSLWYGHPKLNSHYQNQVGPTPAAY